MDRKELALQLHHSNFNCAQCVACSYCNVYGFDPVTVFKLSEAFGAGMFSLITQRLIRCHQLICFLSCFQYPNVFSHNSS